MRISKPIRNLLKYLPVLAVLLATVLGLFIGKDLYPASSDSPSNFFTELTTEPNNPQPLIMQGTMDPCGSHIYTSLPPKCRTLDGRFIPLPGAASYILVTPEGK